MTFSNLQSLCSYLFDAIVALGHSFQAINVFTYLRAPDSLDELEATYWNAQGCDYYGEQRCTRTTAGAYELCQEPLFEH
jgi:hypothetical protein